jgi:LPS-assembly protein
VSRPALRLLPLCLAISHAVCAEEANQNWNYCVSPETIPEFVAQPSEKIGRETAETDIQSNDMNVEKDKETVFEGDVTLQRADQWLRTDKMTYFHETERFSTEGEVRYQDRSVRIIADKASGDQKNDSMSLEGVRYQFSSNLGNGSAIRASMKGDVGELSQATYSTCPPNQRQWEFSAADIKVDQTKARGTATNATLKLGGVPVLWLPYISFPTDDRRRSGILSPTIGNDERNGFDIQLPIYWNIAPNYDATFTPRYMSDRGFMLGGEFRYLTQRSRGEFSSTWLPDDDQTNQDRGINSFQHFTAINSTWYANADLNNVSDRQYFNDFGQSLDATSTSLLASRAGIFGRGENWAASLSFEYWQIANPLFPDGNEPYRRLPRIQAEWLLPVQPWLEFGVAGDITRFTHESLPSASRVDVQPFLRMPFAGNAWYITPEIAWRYTHYQLDDNTLLDRSPTRSLPIISLDAGMVFERSMKFGDAAYLQTLEPRLFYLYTPTRDQSAIPIFDSRDLTFDWPAMFRTNRFGGADRQSDANQATLALTTRFYEESTGRERLSASIGRITYFDTPNVSLPSSPPVSQSGSAWVWQVDWALSDNWNLGYTQQWDPDQKQTQLSGLRSQARWGDAGLFNVSYRYRKNSLEQGDMSFRIPVNKNWNLLGRWNYSIRDRRTLESLAGVEWKSCCVALRVVGRNYIRTFESKSNFGLYVELELNGLGSFGRDTANLLDNAILGYSQTDLSP